MIRTDQRSENEPRELTAPQRRTIAALLSERDVRAASKVANVAEQTIRRWLHQDAAFVAELRQSESILIDAATRRLVQMQGLAVDTLGEMLTNPLAKPTTKLRAAMAILDYMLKLHELRSFDERLSRLEEANHGKS